MKHQKFFRMFCLLFFFCVCNITERTDLFFLFIDRNIWLLLKFFESIKQTFIFFLKRKAPDSSHPSMLPVSNLFLSIHTSRILDVRNLAVILDPHSSLPYSRSANHQVLLILPPYHFFNLSPQLDPCSHSTNSYSDLLPELVKSVM